MTFYESEIKKIRRTVYANQGQLNTVIALRNHINAHYDADLNLNALAHTGFVSKFHLLRLFKKYYGQTPGQYITAKRIEKAREYLQQGMSVTETCFAVGFQTPSSFSTLFKSRTGMAPAAFSKRAIFAKPV